MFKQIATRLTRRKFSWEMMVGNGQICLILMMQILLWIPVVSSALTGTLLVIYGIWWIILGTQPLFLENRSVSVTMGCRIIIICGGSIIGLGIAMILPLTVEVNWVPRMAGIFYGLAIFMYLFVILNMAPITRWLMIGVVCCVIASAYALVCNVLMVINAIVSDVPHIAVHWEQAIGYILSGGAIVGWTSFAIRQATPPNLKVLVPTFLIAGIVYIGMGIALATMLMSRQ